MDIYLAFYFGLACRPADSLVARFVVALFRGTPILARGIGVARFVVGFVLSFVLCFWATGLDAVQRLEQKKLTLLG